MRVAHGAAPAVRARGRARAEGRRWRQGPEGERAVPEGFSPLRRGRPLRLPAGGAVAAAARAGAQRGVLWWFGADQAGQ